MTRRTTMVFTIDHETFKSANRTDLDTPHQGTSVITNKITLLG